jgi:hypothetical protein
MLGFVASVAFQKTDFLGPDTQWRWMLASTSLPPAIVMVQVYLCPESPRWYMEKNKFDKAFHSLQRLRSHDIQAARDMYYAFKLLEVEAAEREGKSLWREFFLVRRNRRAAQSSFFVMFMQQFCGVNVCDGVPREAHAVLSDLRSSHITAPPSSQTVDSPNPKLSWHHWEQEL